MKKQEDKLDKNVDVNLKKQDKSGSDEEEQNRCDTNAVQKLGNHRQTLQRSAHLLEHFDC